MWVCGYVCIKQEIHIHVNVFVWLVNAYIDVYGYRHINMSKYCEHVLCIVCNQQHCSLPKEQLILCPGD